MRLFKRISSTVLASVDRVVSEVENHDAIVESMLKELQHAAADAKVRLKRVKQDGKKMQDRMAALKNDEQTWEQRASNIANEDEQKALACLQRRNKCRDEVSKLKERLLEHNKTQSKLQEQLANIDNRYNQIKQKRHLLQSQQALADANRVVAAVTGSGSMDVEDAFDRWELKIAKAEYGSSSLLDTAETDDDELDAEFDKVEANDELLAELAEIKKSSESQTVNTSTNTAGGENE